MLYQPVVLDEVSVLSKQEDSSNHIIWECSLFERDYNSGFPLVRLNNNALAENGIKRNEWISITSRTNGKVIYRIAKGSGSLFSGLCRGCMMIDAEGAFELGVDALRDENGLRETEGKFVYLADGNASGDRSQLYSADWDIRKASMIGCIRANLQHPDRGYRVSMQVAFIGLALGFLGLVAGILGLVL